MEVIGLLAKMETCRECAQKMDSPDLSAPMKALYTQQYERLQLQLEQA